MTDGNRANENGKRGEELTRNILTIHTGFREMHHRDWNKEGRPAETLVQHAPYASIYGAGTKCRSEFLVSDSEGDLVRIECKTQNVGGSVDEKLPYLFLNASQMWEEPIGLIVLHGKGFRECAVDWLRSVVDDFNRSRPFDGERRLYVQTIPEFMEFVQSHYRTPQQRRQRAQA